MKTAERSNIGLEKLRRRCDIFKCGSCPDIVPLDLYRESHYPGLMMKKEVLISSICLWALGCGVREDHRDVVGQWNGTVRLQDDGCAFGSRLSIVFEHTVSQDGGSVSVVERGGKLLSGRVSHDNDGFSAESIAPEATTIGSQTNCTLTEEIDYSGVNSDEDITADVTLSRIGKCGNDFSCRTVYEGRATRQ